MIFFFAGIEFANRALLRVPRCYRNLRMHFFLFFFFNFSSEDIHQPNLAETFYDLILQPARQYDYGSQHSAPNQ